LPSPRQQSQRSANNAEFREVADSSPSNDRTARRHPIQFWKRNKHESSSHA
jgi:hypothetical protein